MNLREIVNLSTSSVAATLPQFRNEVEPFPESINCTENLRAVIHQLVSYAASVCGNKPLRILAKKFSSIILLQVKVNDSNHRSNLEDGISKIRPLAEALGGCLYVTHSCLYESTISFTFLSKVIN